MFSTIGAEEAFVTSTSNAIVSPLVNVNGVATAPQFAQRIAPSPVPSTRVSGHSVPHCAQPALLTKAGSGSIYLGIPGDIDGSGPSTVPLGGWATHKYGVNANQPGNGTLVDVTFSDCTVQITDLGKELGAPTPSWQEAFEEDLCAVGGDTNGTDAG